ncbi:MAG TPA: hypothetical protein DCL41_11225 [Bdellovibrionales bacterium]|nr:hypothetical protein [Pseudobdellovibrionaceae bacterium]HAG92438.1 hypothetical protein [Bdellovibrionales bacterium]|tara:strand:- start:2168 stop:4111 length:1944 start_codon:yes stop_codon:yes gene_type:complete
MKRSDIKVLIVEDDKSFGKVLKESLSKLGMSIVVETTPEKALKMVRLESFQLAIIDCMLPKMNGIDLAVEMRKTQFSQNPVVLMSGIFKEKAFENESLTKTGAVAFLPKPFELAELETLITKTLSGLLQSESWSLKSLLARRLRSIRDRMKVIESLESISGLDIPMIFSILSDAKVSGHLTLVTPEAEIYGVTFGKGSIQAFDSEKAEEIILDQLKEKDFLSEEDWNEFQSLGEKGSVINKLINKGYVSPHAIQSARAYQIRMELSHLMSLPTFQVSFVPDSKIDDDGGLDFFEAYEALQSEFSNHVDLPYFHSLYQEYMDAPIRLTELGVEEQNIWSSDSLVGFSGLKEKIEQSYSLSEILSETSDEELKVFEAIHLLLVNRMVLFDDLQKTKNAKASLERFKKLKRDLEKLDAQEIFMYFGSSERVLEPEVEKIYSSFKETNHPDSLRTDSNEAQEIAKEVFELVTNAYSILIDASKRESFFAKQEERKEALRVEAAALYEAALSQLRKGQAAMALKSINQAYAKQPTPRYFFIKVWAEMKGGSKSVTPSELSEWLQKMDGFSVNERKDPFYWMALGVLKRNSEDPTAVGCFEKALSLDSGFVEARRELNSIRVQSGQEKNSKPMDFLKGDITELVSQIFRKKSG